MGPLYAEQHGRCRVELAPVCQLLSELLFGLSERLQRSITKPRPKHQAQELTPQRPATRIYLVLQL